MSDSNNHAQHNALLLEQFRTYLEQTEANTDEVVEAAHQIDLYSLFVELTALKNEVKLESRQVKTAVGEFKNVFDLLQNSHDELNVELERNRAAQSEQVKATLRPLLLELLELYDRLEAGLHTLQRHSNSTAQQSQREKTLIAAVHEAQQMSLRRLQQLLHGQQVSVLADPVGKPLDPHTMNAVDVGYQADKANGIVIEQLRQGFNWHDELLRSAEVKVNKLPEPAPKPHWLKTLFAKLKIFR